MAKPVLAQRESGGRHGGQKFLASEKIFRINPNQQWQEKRPMGFRRSDLQEAFFVPGTHAFRVYGYGTTDLLEDVLAPDYFAAARGLLRAGELIYVTLFPQATRGGTAEPGEPRMALVMVRADERDPERAGASARLVQDFGRPSDAPATFELPAPSEPGAVPPEAPVKRGRGRPPGSRTKKPATFMQAQ
jgi:hypothetical protein